MVEDFDEETVKSSDKDELEQLVKDIDNQLNTGNLTAKDKAALEKAKAEAEKAKAKEKKSKPVEK